jgi:hypothetical protein
MVPSIATSGREATNSGISRLHQASRMSFPSSRGEQLERGKCRDQFDHRSRIERPIRAHRQNHPVAVQVVDVHADLTLRHAGRCQSVCHRPRQLFGGPQAAGAAGRAQQAIIKRRRNMLIRAQS